MKAHYRLGKVGVAGPLTKAVYADLDLSGPSLDRSQAIGHSQAKVVMAVDVDHHIDIITDVLDKTIEAGWNCHSDSVRDVDDIAMRLLYRLEDAVQKFRRGPGGIHCREETGPSMILHKLDRLSGPFYDLIVAFLNCMSDLNVRGGNEDMHHTHIGIKTGLGILLYDSRETADLSLQACSCDLTDAVKLALRRDGKPGLDNIHTEFIKLPGDLELLLLGK